MVRIEEEFQDQDLHEEEDDEITETVEDTEEMLHALIDLLIKKGVINEDEFKAQVETNAAEDDDEEE